MLTKKPLNLPVPNQMKPNVVFFGESISNEVKDRSYVLSLCDTRCRRPKLTDLFSRSA